ncbi:MAG: hypothetical protein LBP25_00505 [Tannerellaceae bacterium]|jgi:hypothetical protein|nr:hypothetical protein [Tannerellaceae bacterium]
MQIDFQQMLKEEFEQFVLSQQHRFPPEETLKADLHCHDFNSDVPDELMGRILNVPETWLPSETLMEKLRHNACSVFTVTNHNNARSCYALQDKGLDILVGAEFSCLAPDFEIGIHVLAYGFTPEQEIRLERLRKNLYHFLEYARRQDIPTIWAHPLYHYSSRRTPPAAFFRKMLLVFERFEVINGQRDTWQNLLVKEWLENVSPEEIERSAGEFDIDPLRFCSDAFRKSFSGGSDCHMGIFAGMTGTYLHVPNLQKRLDAEPRSRLALEAIRNGAMAPFGTFQNAEKMTIAFLDYACQIALNYTDPGLLRMLLHRGSPQDKLLSFAVSNLCSEMQQHKVTTSFVQIFHDSLMGKKPSRLKQFLVKKAYRPIFGEALRIAGLNRCGGKDLIDGYYRSILEINRRLYAILSGRLEKKLAKAGGKGTGRESSPAAWIEKLELPVGLRAYTDSDRRHGKQGVDIPSFLDGLPFPFFGSALILAAHFISARTMFNIRPLLKEFSGRLNRLEHPERVLWLTDTWQGDSEAALFLREMHAGIKRRQLPADIAICSSDVQPEAHLIVLPPVGEYSLPFGREYTCRFPDFIALHNLFLSGGYDRIVCSTEGVMGLAGLYLKHAYSVEALFCMHADRLAFARAELHLEGHNLNRFRRILRFFYRSFDRLAALTSDTYNVKITGEMLRSGKEVYLADNRQEMLEQLTGFIKDTTYSMTV